MGYSTPILGVERERNFAGSDIDDDGTLTITSPDSIEGSSVYVGWSLQGTLADTVRVILGTTPTDSQIADSGDLTVNSANQVHVFNDLEYPTAIAYLTIKYKFGSGGYHAVQRILPVNVEQVIVDPTPALNWDDDLLWDDTKVWAE